MKKSLKGFTLVEMLIVIVAVGIIGSMTARLLIQGSDIFVGETNRQSFMSEVRFAFWRVMRESHGQVSKEQFFLQPKDMYLKHSMVIISKLKLILLIILYWIKMG